jgi:hypothetical protein
MSRWAQRLDPGPSPCVGLVAHQCDVEISRRRSHSCQRSGGERPRAGMRRAHRVTAMFAACDVHDQVAKSLLNLAPADAEAGSWFAFGGRVASPGAECLADAINSVRVRLVGLVMRVQVAWLDRWPPSRGCHRGARSRLRSCDRRMGAVPHVLRRQDWQGRCSIDNRHAGRDHGV